MERSKDLKSESRRRFLKGTARLAAAGVMPGGQIPLSPSVIEQAFALSSMPAQKAGSALAKILARKLYYFLSELNEFKDITPITTTLLKKAATGKSPELDEEIFEQVRDLTINLGHQAQDLLSPQYIGHKVTQGDILHSLTQYDLEGTTAEKLAMLRDPTHAKKVLESAINTTVQHLAALEEALTDAAKSKRALFDESHIAYEWDGENLFLEIDANTTIFDEQALHYLIEHESLAWGELPLNFFNLPKPLKDSLHDFHKSDYFKMKLTEFENPEDFFASYGFNRLPDSFPKTEEELKKIAEFQNMFTGLKSDIIFPKGTHIDDICQVVKDMKPNPIERFYRTADGEFQNERWNTLNKLDEYFLDSPVTLQKIDGEANDDPDKPTKTHELYTISGKDVDFKALLKVATPLQSLTNYAIFCKDPEQNIISFAVPRKASDDLDLVNTYIERQNAHKGLFEGLQILKEAREEEARQAAQNAAENPKMALRGRLLDALDLNF